MQSLAGMKAHARDLVSNIGHGTSHFAKRVGGGTAALARRVGDGTADIARRVGPRRAVIGVAAISAAVAGSIILMRYLKRRRAEQQQMVDYDALEEPSTSAGVRVRESSRMQRQPMRPSGY